LQQRYRHLLKVAHSPKSAPYRVTSFFDLVSYPIAKNAP